MSSAGVEARSSAADSRGASPVLPDVALQAGTYVTDGGSLLRVEQAYVVTSSGVRFVELEDCATTEVSVWALSELACRSLRTVTPMDAQKLARELFEAEMGRPLDGLIGEGSSLCPGDGLVAGASRVSAA